MDVNTELTLPNKADYYRSGSSKENPSPVNEQPRQSTPPSATRTISIDNEEKCEVDESGNHEMEVIDVDADEVTIVPPKSPNPVVKPEDIQQLADESQKSEEEQEPQSDLEMQRQRQREARRGPTPSSSSSPQARSRKTPPVISKAGVKRDREEYEEGQADEEDNDRDVGIDKPGIVHQQHQERPNGSPVHGSKSTETQADADNSEEIVILDRELKLKDDKPKRRKGKKVSTDARQVTEQTEIIKSPTSSTTTTTTTTTTSKGGPNPKAPAKRSHYRDFIGPPIQLTSLRSFVTSQPPSAISLPLPSPQPRLPKKLGINHMDLLYKAEQEVLVCRICL